MKILIATDSFKGSLSAIQVARHIEKGILNVLPSAQIFKIPVADGGEGTIDAILSAKGGEKIWIDAHDPLNRKIKANYAILNDQTTAIIEMATASGLPLLTPVERNPLQTSTFGTGELLKNAVEQIQTTLTKNPEKKLEKAKIVVCIGGSATNDAGAGMLQALGAQFLDKFGKEINVCGGNLKEIKNINLSKFLNLDSFELVVACDVENPLLGDQGASAIFAPQKGANPEKVQILEENICYFADLVENTFPNLKGLRHQKGAGAAGGLGYGLLAFLHAKMQKGVDIVMEITQLEQILKTFSKENRDLVITGEGAIDYQTLFGKVPLGVARLAKKYDLKVIGIAGTLGKDYQTLYNQGFDSLFSITDKPMSLQEAIENADRLLESIAERVMRVYL
jgi:glycerate kinase